VCFLKYFQFLESHTKKTKISQENSKMIWSEWKFSFSLSLIIKKLKKNLAKYLFKRQKKKKRRQLLLLLQLQRQHRSKRMKKEKVKVISFLLNETTYKQKEQLKFELLYFFCRSCWLLLFLFPQIKLFIKILSFRITKRRRRRRNMWIDLRWVFDSSLNEWTF